MAYFAVRGWPDFSQCQPPACLYESDRGFENGDFAALVLGGAATYRVWHFLLRADLRWFFSDGAHRGVLNTGLGMGFAVR